LHIRGASATDAFTVNPGSLTHADSVVTFDSASAGNLILDTGAFAIPAGVSSGTSLTISGQGAAQFGAGAALGVLGIDSAHVTLTGAAGTVLSVLDLRISNGGSLDLAHESLAIRSGAASDPAPRIRSYLQSPSTLTSTAADGSHGIALADAADGTVASLPSQGLLLKLAHAGDANLDGTANFTDLLLLAQHYGQSAVNWDQGDFTNDASVGFSDLLTLAQNYGSSGSSAAAVSPLVAAAPTVAAARDQTKLRPSRRRPALLF